MSSVQPRSADAHGRHLHVMRWYSSQARAARRRRPTDVALVVASALGLLTLSIVAPGPTIVDEGVGVLTGSLPAVLEWVVALMYGLAALWAILLTVVAAFSRHRRLIAVEMLAAGALALAIGWVVGSWASTQGHQTWSALWETGPPQVYVAVRVAVVTAVIGAASPHLARPMRVIGRFLLSWMALAAAVIGVAHPIGVVAGFLIGVMAAAAVHVVLGSPAGRPTPQQVRDALMDLGVDDPDVEAAASPHLDVTIYAARNAAHGSLSVEVLGRDEWSAQSLASVWTAATRRGEHLNVRSSRLERVEHAAMLTLLAAQAGVRTPRLVTAGQSAEGDALIVTEAFGAALADLPPAAVTDQLMDAAGAQLSTLHAAGICHGRIDDRRIVVDDEQRAALIDFTAACVGAEHRQLMIDQARFLVAIGLATGAPRAVASVRRTFGDQGLVDILPFLQPAILDRHTRARTQDGALTLPTLREEILRQTGVEEPPLAQVSRVTLRSLVRVAIIGVVSYTLITALSDADLSSIKDALSGADWTWLLAALMLSPVAEVFFSFSTIGATTAALRYIPVLMLQYAAQFIALVLPATAARIALDVRFFRSFGVPAGSAISLGIIDSVSGFLVQVLLLIVILLSDLPGLTSSIRDGSSSGTESLADPTTHSMLFLTLALALVSIVGVAVVPRLRRRFLDRGRLAWASLKEQTGNARGALAVLRHPLKIAEMLGGNLGGQVVQAIVLGLCVHAFGQDAQLSQLILINTAVSLFAGLMPVPGGMGVAEAGYTAGLEAIGISSPIAISIAITFRLVTFYLPPIWGSVAMRWLRHRSYV